MAKKVFKSELSVKGIENLKKQLQNYKDVELPNKCRQLATRLLEIGLPVAQAKIEESPLGKYVTLRTEMNPEQFGTKAILIATGEVKEAEGYEPFNTLLAIEFGAGIHYNQKTNPKSKEFGYGVGTFPNQSHALNEDGWYFWDDKKQQWIHSFGVKATMPMYNADMEIINSVLIAVKEVFG